MQVRRLRVHNLRCLQEVELAPGPGLNLLVGDNGAGKTSVLEALHLMAYGRSFRGRVRDGLIRTGAEAVEVFVEWAERASPRIRRSGLRHAGQSWEGRLDGEAVDQLNSLCAAFVVVSYEPGSPALVTGPAEGRRRYLDWGLFHVEPDFFPIWRRYSRALKQRNALLKQGGADRLLDSWDHELAETGEQLGVRRRRYLDRLQDSLSPTIARLAPALGDGVLGYLPGWRAEDCSLADALLISRDRDRLQGYTSVGPHRADWRLDLAGMPNREPLSRGQAKLAALSCLMAQAADYAGHSGGDWPVMVFDDLASELDPDHRGRVLNHLLDSGAQVFISGTEPPPGPLADAAVFHVKHGKVGSAPG